MKTLTPKCEYADCTKEATTLVYSRNKGEVMSCCTAHAYDVAVEDSPEYTEECENCGCLLPVN